MMASTLSSHGSRRELVLLDLLPPVGRETFLFSESLEQSLDLSFVALRLLHGQSRSMVGRLGVVLLDEGELDPTHSVLKPSSRLDECVGSSTLPRRQTVLTCGFSEGRLGPLELQTRLTQSALSPTEFGEAFIQSSLPQLQQPKKALSSLLEHASAHR